VTWNGLPSGAPAASVAPRPYTPRTTDSVGAVGRGRGSGGTATGEAGARPALSRNCIAAFGGGARSPDPPRPMPFARKGKDRRAPPLCPRRSPALLLGLAPGASTTAFATRQRPLGGHAARGLRAPRRRRLAPGPAVAGRRLCRVRRRGGPRRHGRRRRPRCARPTLPGSLPGTRCPERSPTSKSGRPRWSPPAGSRREADAGGGRRWPRSALLRRAGSGRRAERAGADRDAGSRSKAPSATTSTTT
jgi:hypothetical protein